MSSTVITSGSAAKISARNVLNRAAQAWFVVATAGQFAFVAYIIAFYWLNALGGNYAAWANVLPHGMVEGDVIGNVAVWLHVIVAAVVIACGPLQLIPAVRSSFPRFHRWTGRVYIVAALIVTLVGLYTVWTRGTVGNMVQHIGITLNGVLIIAFAIMALFYAVSGKFSLHRRWALRLFMVISGVWFFRIGLMFWLTANQGPVGIDFESFTGPFLYFLAFANYLLPLAVLELYFKAQQGSNVLRWTVSLVLLAAVVVTAIGIFAASLGLWLPRI